MSEEFPQDPDQIQPPQEGGVTHIEVNSHEGDVQEPQAIENEQAAEDEPTHLGTVEHDNSAQNGTPDEQEGPDYIKDKDKAEVMAHAHNDALDYNDGKSQEEWQEGWYTEGNKPSWKSPEQDAGIAGNEYDLEVALNTEKWSHIHTPEEARKFASANRSVFLKYSHAIAENYRKYGDKLSPSLEALDMVHNLVKDYGYTTFDTVRTNHDPNSVRVELDDSGGGAVIVSTMRYSSEPREQWRLPMFGRGEYTITQTAGDPDGEFSRVETKKTRSLNEVDVANLGKFLEPAVKFRAQEEKLQQKAHENYDGSGDEEDDVFVSTTEIQNRATARMGNTEEAREAARDFPGDFI